MPGTIGDDDAAERVGALELGVDVDCLRRELGGEESERD
jgi:hypothetical protein